MADIKDKKIAEEQKIQKIRLVVTSRDVQKLENFTTEIIKRAKGSQSSVTFKGPVRMPTKHLKMCVRKSPCGEGSKTWDRYEMRIHKRVLDFTCSLPTFKEVSNMPIPPQIFIVVDVKE